jgi:hypothetical protein
VSTQQPERPTCATCPYWTNADDPGEEAGACGRYPPRIVGSIVTELASRMLALRGPTSDDDVLDSRISAAMTAVVTEWPYTERDAWCGEHPDFPAWLAATRPKT